MYVHAAAPHDNCSADFVVGASYSSYALDPYSAHLDLATSASTASPATSTAFSFSNFSTARNASGTCVLRNDIVLWSDTSGWDAFGRWENDAGTNFSETYKLAKSGSTHGPSSALARLPACNAAVDPNTAANDRPAVRRNHVRSSTSLSSPKIDSISNGIQLRILPLGASIVYGSQSPDQNGFRYGLRNQLVYNGNPVNMVGSVQSGTMADNDCEGWPGYVITQVAEKAELSIPSKPNLVLLHVGTNDCVQSIDIQV